MVWVLGAVSFLTDLASEMIYPLLPLFLFTALGAGPFALGVIEGAAESTASLLKVVSGAWTDRMRRRKPLVLWGYGLSSFVRPLIGLAGSWPWVLMMRMGDRIGKGLRTSPRDALIADVTEHDQRGAAYGVHRAMDHAGAVVGPLVAMSLLYLGFSLQQVFLLSVIPGVLVVLIIVVGVKESETPFPVSPTFTLPLDGGGKGRGWRKLGPDFQRLLWALFVFTLGNSTDAFLLLRLSDAGLSPGWIAGLWSVLHVVKSGCTAWGGRLADQWGSRPPILVGWLVYAACYGVFGWTTHSAVLVSTFLFYGVYFGLTEPAERKWVARLASTEVRGSAFGYYHGVIGFGALPASLLFGALWSAAGPAAAFGTGAGLALLAALLLLRVEEPHSSQHV